MEKLFEVLDHAPANKLIVCVCRGGLANRLKPLASCFAVAQQTGRQLAINWTSDPHCHATFSELYDNKIKEVELESMIEANRCKLYADAKTIDKVRFEKLQRMRNVCDFSPIHKTSEIVNDNHDYIVVYGNDFFYGLNSSRLIAFFNWLQPIADIRHRIIEANKILCLDKEVVGVHARGTDSGVPIEYYLEKMRQEKSRNHSARFFVSSDCADYQSRIISEFPETLTNKKTAYVEKTTPNSIWATSAIERS
jgi:hypothetical protein